jgi:transposase-like protein
MYDYYDYYEPSAAEEAMLEIENILKQGIKQEIKDELERLRKENAELREFRDEKQSYDFKMAELKRDCEYKIADAERKAKAMRIHDLFGDNIGVGYMVTSNYKKRPKCDRCNAKRQIEYKTPLGRDAYENCYCDGYDYVYEVKEVEMIQFTIVKNYTEYVTKYFRHAKNTYDDHEDYNEYDPVTKVYKGEDFKDVEHSTYYPTVFLDRDKCQEYCDWLNEQKKKE